MTDARRTSTRPRSPASQPRPAAGGIRRARCARCTTSIRCGSSTSSAAGPLAGPRGGRRRLRRRTARRGDGAQGRARVGLDLGAGTARASRSCTRSSPASRSTTGSSRPSSTPPTHAGALRRGDLHGDARARARPGRGRRGARDARAPRRPRVRLDAQPHAARLPAWPSSARSTCCACCPRARTPTRSSSARPSSPRWARAAGLAHARRRGPRLRSVRAHGAASSTDARVNYLMHFRKPAAAQASTHDAARTPHCCSTSTARCSTRPPTWAAR